MALSSKPIRFLTYPLLGQVKEQVRAEFFGRELARRVGRPVILEQARTYESVGVTPAFHRGAEWLYALFATTPFANETRATQPKERSLDDALAALTAAMTRERRA